MSSGCLIVGREGESWQYLEWAAFPFGIVRVEMHAVLHDEVAWYNQSESGWYLLLCYRPRVLEFQKCSSISGSLILIILRLGDRLTLSTLLRIANSHLRSSRTAFGRL
jgi:hypothetical protein